MDLAKLSKELAELLEPADAMNRSRKSRSDGAPRKEFAWVFRLLSQLEGPSLFVNDSVCLMVNAVYVLRPPPPAHVAPVVGGQLRKFCPSIVVHLQPLELLPIFFSRTGWRMPVTIALW